MIFEIDIPCEDCGQNPATSLFHRLKLCNDCFGKRSWEQKAESGLEKSIRRRIRLKEELSR